MIRWVKRAFHPAKLGHAGTLDPLASGLLILLVGAATKRQSHIMGQTKIYRCTMKLGVKTDSADLMGHVVEEKPVPPLTREQVEAVFKQFIGDSEQIPPMYAAIKKDGVPLYKLARQGITIERAARKISIHSLELLDVRPNEIDFRATCSSGTYVRTLVEDIAAKLGTVSAVSALEREAIGSYTVAQALDGNKLKAMTSEELWQKVAS
jgi:tRNA pseudouridine55 synthase